MFSLGYELQMTQSLKLTQEQRLLLRQFSFSLRLQLIQALRDEKYHPEGNCPSCDRKMTPTEIIEGFNQDPNDFTTRCPGCWCRF